MLHAIEIEQWEVQMFVRDKLIGVTIIALVFLVSSCTKYPNCKKDDDCHEAEYCVNNLCQQCRDNGDCGEGQECMDGRCEEIPGYCTSSADCAEGQVCRENRCGPCVANGDCAEGQVCMNGVCGKAECQTDEECPAGLSCVNYHCKVVEAAVTPDESGCELEPIYFEFDSSTLSPEMRSKLEADYDCYKKSGGSLKIEGHCDPRGTTEYNMGLGDRRARIVGKVLNTLGVEKSNMKMVSKGEEEATGTNESGWAMDRKVILK
jgi:peptidoglycan-associated lipoprotein